MSKEAAGGRSARLPSVWCCCDQSVFIMAVWPFPMWSCDLLSRAEEGGLPLFSLSLIVRLLCPISFYFCNQTLLFCFIIFLIIDSILYTITMICIFFCIFTPLVTSTCYRNKADFDWFCRCPQRRPRSEGDEAVKGVGKRWKGWMKEGEQQLTDEHCTE